jgi:hypothetical protein
MTEHRHKDIGIEHFVLSHPGSSGTVLLTLIRFPLLLMGLSDFNSLRTAMILSLVLFTRSSNKKKNADTDRYIVLFLSIF